ncbi:MAG: ATP-binding protein [Bacteroidota bacterium]
MTNEQKKQVRDALVRYTANFATQTEAAESLQGISASTISLVRNNNWELLSERLWHHVARQVGFYCGEWEPADTSGYLLLRILLGDAQHYRMMYGIAVGEGLGKTFTAAHYTRENPGVCYMACNAIYNRKSFLTALVSNAGMQPAGTVPELMRQFTTHMESMEEPLLVLDDAHKLKDRVLHLVVMIANSLTGKAGVVIMGNGDLRPRVIEGVRLKKAGFDEIYKGIGRRFITLTTLAPRDVELVCRANGMHDEDVIKHITEECGNSLHAATRLVIQYNEHNIAA